jgi:hypothetical protein
VPIRERLFGMFTVRSMVVPPSRCLDSAKPVAHPPSQIRFLLAPLAMMAPLTT